MQSQHLRGLESSLDQASDSVTCNSLERETGGSSRVRLSPSPHHSNITSISGDDIYGDVNPQSVMICRCPVCSKRRQQLGNIRDTSELRGIDFYLKCVNVIPAL
ncbi:hypothetical protein J6590_078728 [Homalodisca vitripennis]|nr:hypothetical protein J6590_078728 [Homalodisca vitripennis]